MAVEGSFDVAIVGYGPIGALLANLLGKSGLRVVVLEREAASNPLPRAVTFDTEVMRIFRSLGLEKQISGIARPTTTGTRFVDASGKMLLQRRGSNWLFHQPHLENELRNGATRFSNVEVLLDHEVVAIVDNGQDVSIRATDRTEGTARDFRATYVVGCDGARSFVRRFMDTSVEDLGLHQPWLVVDLLVNPASPRAKKLSEYSIHLCDPARPMTFFWVGGNRRRWEIMLMPGDDPATIAEPGRFWPLLAPWLLPSDATIERSAVYTFHSVIARGWRRGRLMLAGDSCHQTPPFLGQGMCAGMRDAANLAWKLAAVIQRNRDQCLLDTYESERRPHVKTFIELAVELGAVIQATDSEVIAERNRRFASGTHAFGYPQPQLGPGVRDPGEVPLGTLFPESRLPDGRTLDEEIDGRFAIVGDEQVIASVDSTAQARWRDFDFATVRAPGDAAESACREWGVKAVLLRPDAYVFGMARDAEELSDLTERFTAHLQRNEAGQQARGKSDETRLFR